MPYCANCGHQISDQAVMCPNCGHPNQSSLPGGGVAVSRYAGFWRRFVALLIDGIIIGIVSIPFRTSIEAGNGVRVVYGPSTPLMFLYAWLMLAYAKGQTIGKMALGIRITNPDGRPLGVGQAAARQGMAIVSGIAFGLGYLWAAWDPEKRTWHDMVANTRAFKAR